MAFYVQLPSDDDGNPWHRAAVIEATEESNEYGTVRLHVSAPSNFPWPVVLKGAGDYNRWVETEGPARFLDHDEYLALVRQHGWTGALS